MKKLGVAVLLLAFLFMSAGCQRAIRRRNQILNQNQSQGQRQADDQAAVMGTLMHLAVACHLHAEAHDGVLPAKMADVNTYGRDINLDDYLLVASGRVLDIDDTGKTILIRKKAPLANGKQAVVYVDGRAAAMPMHRPAPVIQAASLDQGTPTMRVSPQNSQETSPPRSTVRRPKWHFGRAAASDQAAQSKRVSPIKTMEASDPPVTTRQPKLHVSRTVSPDETGQTHQTPPQKSREASAPPAGPRKPKWHFGRD